MALHSETTRQVTLLKEFIGVPKPAIQAVLGKALGQRIWQHLRTRPVPSAAVAQRTITDTEILHGMLDYLSRQAAAALCDHQRLAKAIALEIFYADGSSSLHRMRLAAPTHDAFVLLNSATELFHRSQLTDAPVASLNLKLSSMEFATVPASSRNWDYALTPSVARI